MKNLFLQPGESEMEIYVLEKEKPVVLKCLISRSPLQKITDKKLEVNIPSSGKDSHGYLLRQGYFLFLLRERTRGNI